ncbi:uncharacterized protein AAGF69_008384 isoform 1-T3 [Amazona ochrocephala]
MSFQRQSPSAGKPSVIPGLTHWKRLEMNSTTAHTEGDQAELPCTQASTALQNVTCYSLQYDKQVNIQQLHGVMGQQCKTCNLQPMQRVIMYNPTVKRQRMKSHPLLLLLLQDINTEAVGGAQI